MNKNYACKYGVYMTDKMVDDGRNWFEECKMIANDYNELMNFRNKILEENRELKETIVKMCKNFRYAKKGK